jgi:hypothetical protein
VGRFRQPVGAPNWLWVILAVAAMGFSLGHTVADLGIIFGSLSSSFGVKQSLLSVLIGVLYSWWAWVFAGQLAGNSGKHHHHAGPSDSDYCSADIAGERLSRDF